MQQRIVDKLMYSMREDLKTMDTEQTIFQLEKLLDANTKNDICVLIRTLKDGIRKIRRNTLWELDALFNGKNALPNPFKMSNSNYWKGTGMTVAGLKSKYRKDECNYYHPITRQYTSVGMEENDRLDYDSPLRNYRGVLQVTTEQLYGEIRLLLYSLTLKWEHVFDDEQKFMICADWSEVYEVLETPT